MHVANILTPRWCRWDPEKPPPLTLWLCLLYAFAGGFFSANLFYSHPILDVLAHDFHTTQTGVANIPTLAQAGDATGLLLILPLADYFPRRKFSLLLLSLTIVFWIGLCFINNLTVFSVLTYLSAVFTGVLNIFIVLVSESSDASNRAFNISIVAAGPTFGILLARILSGVVATYTSWRNVYILSLALQVTMLILLYLFMPDYPPINKLSPIQVIKRYPRTIRSIITMNFRHPVLMQASLLSFLTFFTVSSYWTTLTFLLSEPFYNYTPFVIGLFGLIGASTMVLGPLYGKYIITPINTPLLSAVIGKLVSLVGIIIGTFTGKFNIAGPIIQAVLLDAGLMILQIASRVAIHDVEPLSSNQVNTAFVSMLYLGMLTGTKAGNQVYAKCGGWLASGGLSVGVICFSFVVILVRGPHVKGSQWFGWSGGWSRTPTHAIDVEKSADLDTGFAGGIDTKDVGQTMGQEIEKQLVLDTKMEVVIVANDVSDHPGLERAVDKKPTQN